MFELLAFAVHCCLLPLLLLLLLLWAALFKQAVFRTRVGSRSCLVSVQQQSQRTQQQIKRFELLAFVAVRCCLLPLLLLLLLLLP